MRTKQTVRAGYNKIADAYLAIRTENSEDVQLLQELVQRLPRGARVLDAGCGAGVPVTRILSEHFQVTGVDFAEAQIELARQLVPRAQFLRQDIAELAFPDQSFDAICSYYAIIHIPRREHRGILRNFHRMLKPAGWLLVCMGANDTEEGIEEDWFGSRMIWSHYDAATNLRMVQECGLNIVISMLVADITEPAAKHLFILASRD